MFLILPGIPAKGARCTQMLVCEGRRKHVQLAALFGAGHHGGGSMAEGSEGAARGGRRLEREPGEKEFAPMPAEGARPSVKP